MATMAIAALEKKVAKDTIDQACQMFGLDYVEVASALGVDRRTILGLYQNTPIFISLAETQLNKLHWTACKNDQM